MYVVIGGNGFLGGHLIQQIRNVTDELIVASFHSKKGGEGVSNLTWVELDVTNTDSIFKFYDAIRKLRKSGELIKCIYTSGYIKPDECLRNPNIAVKNNILSLINFIAITRELIDSLIFTSTDFVFEESQSSYRYKEEDEPNPINFYGTIKLICEKIIIRNNYTVVRLPFMFGRSLNPNKEHFIEHIERVIKNNEVFYVLSDYYENSLDYGTVARCITNLFFLYQTKIPFPIIHICGDLPVSKYEIALEYASKQGLNSDCIKPLKLEEASFFLAKRATILLDNSLVKSLLGLKNLEFKV